MLLINNEIQKNKIFEKKIKCEPFFTKYNLIRTTRIGSNKLETDLSNLTAYVDRNYDLSELSKLFGKSKKYLSKNLKILVNKKIIREFY